MKKFIAISAVISCTFLCLILLGPDTVFVGVAHGQAISCDNGAETQSQEIELESLKQILLLEKKADQARALYWKGFYNEARKVFRELTLGAHPNKILYFQEAGMCSLAMHDYESAKRELLEAASLQDNFKLDLEREKKALSVFGAETEKVYRGDPYERSFLYALLALLFMQDGDYDNALAACKNGLLADSDASENLYESDICLLHGLYARLCMLRQDAEEFSLNSAKAKQASMLTSGALRELVSNRLDLLALLKMTDDERTALEELRTPQDLKLEIEKLSQKIDQKTRQLTQTTKWGEFYKGDYNVLLVLPKGRSITKYRTGREMELVVFTPPTNDTGCSTGIVVDGSLLNLQKTDEIFLDVAYQATTRGGRRMDAILRGKAQSRRTTLAVGNSMLEVGNQAGGMVGLVFSLMGAVAQGISAGMNAEADIRCWKTLPDKLMVVPLKLKPGVHDFYTTQNLYFYKSNQEKNQLLVTENPSDLKVVFLTPGRKGIIHTGHLKTSKKDQKLTLDSKAWLLTPIIGLPRFIQVASSDNSKPKFIIPNMKKAMRKVRNSLKKQGLVVGLVTPEEIKGLVDANDLREGHAVQIHYLGMRKNVKKDGCELCIKLRFDVVDVPEGNILFSSKQEQHLKVLEGASLANAFYKALSDSCKTVMAEYKDYESSLAINSTTDSKKIAN